MQTNFSLDQFNVKNGVAFVGATDGERVTVNVDGQVKAAINAFSELVLGDRYLYHAKGLHLKFDPANMPQAAKNAGHVSQDYTGDLCKAPEHGWAPVYVEYWTVMTGKAMELRQFEQNEPEWVNRHRRSIRKMVAMDMLCDGKKLVLLPNFRDAEGNFSIAAAEKYFADVVDTLSKTVAEARAKITEKVVNKRSYEQAGKLAANPMRVAELAEGTLTVKVFGGDVMPVHDLLGHTIRTYAGKIPVGGLYTVAQGNLAFVTARCVSQNLSVEVVA